jgi:hypothetical protein
MSEAQPSLSRRELVVLARLSSKAARQPTPSAITAALAMIVTPNATKSESRAEIDRILADLARRSLIDERLALTETGRHELAAAVGLGKVPTWKDFQNRYLPALAVGCGGPDAPKTAEAFQAAILATHLGMQRREKLTAQLDAIVADALGLAAGPVTMDRIRAHFLARRAGVDDRGRATEIASQVACRAVRAHNRTALKASAVKRWVAGEAITPAAPAPVATAAPAVSQPAPVRRPLDDSSFAAMINDTAHKIGPDGRYGGHKVFVSAIWRNLSDELQGRGMGLDELKRRLVDANRAGLLSLARADLVGAMNPEEVKLSEILDRGASFHFVLDNSRLS